MLDLDELERLLDRRTFTRWMAEKRPIGDRESCFADGSPIADVFDGPGRIVAYCIPVVDAELIVALRNAAPELLRAAREAERLREHVRVLREALDLVNHCEAMGRVSESVRGVLRQALSATAPETKETK